MDKNPMDKWFENSARNLARTRSRRSILRGLGTLLLGASAYPLLPVYRGANAAETGQGDDPGDPRDCSYWRYCAIDGALCSCCGGTVSTCPPGTVMSTITWIGTCRNPADGKDYVISYNDCCGKAHCGRCSCMRNDGDTPAYRPATSNNINWCSGSTRDVVYNCSTAIIIGVDQRSRNG